MRRTYFFVGVEPARAVDVRPVGAMVLDNVTPYEKKNSQVNVPHEVVKENGKRTTESHAATETSSA
jgi:hypothetical protein